MKFNSQICTTREQSERLLALGLKKETADMVLCEPFDYEKRKYSDGNVKIVLEEGEDFCKDDIPAWSLHRLFQIYTSKSQYSSWNMAQFNWDILIDCIEDDIAKGYFNKEYLVDQEAIEEHCKGVMEYLDYIRKED